ncbi:MAG: methionyl-tRNA formyltransferase [Betaproteobacteria bacterium]|nr:methionyl-tRNA formyltransferase [Betaproteobacteria bacterium]
MKVIFAGTPEFAASALQALLDGAHEVVLVLTQPDRPAGRGMKPLPSPVKRLAQSRGLQLMQSATLKDAAIQSDIVRVEADVMVVAAYGLILPQPVLLAAHHGALNIHASLLPRWRGAAPIQRAILAGDRETGVCIMRMEAGLDTGPVLLREATPILESDTAQTLHDRLASLGAALLVAALSDLEGGTLLPASQPDEGVTYARKIEKSEARINWRLSAEAIGRQIRAFNPYPGATSRLEGAEVKVWHAVTDARVAAPGAVLAVSGEGIIVGCGDGSLRLLELQRAGGKKLDASTFLRGFPVPVGTQFS